MAAIENARSALATATGQAAEATAILTLCSGGDHIVSARRSTAAHTHVKKLGIETTFVHPDEPQNFRRALKPKLVYAETLGNPPSTSSTSRRWRRSRTKPTSRSSSTTPCLRRTSAGRWNGARRRGPFATKYIGGHGTTMGGVICESGKFNWGNMEVPRVHEPLARLPRRHLPRDLRRLRLHDEARMEIMRTFGPALSPLNAWLLLQGLESLPCGWTATARTPSLRSSCRGHKRVAWVNYPGLPDNKYHALARSTCRKARRGCSTSA